MMRHLYDQSGTGFLCGGETSGEVARSLFDVSCHLCIKASGTRKGGRPKKGRADRWKSPKSARLIALAEIEIARAAQMLLHASGKLAELGDAEVEIDKALHRVKNVMALEAEIRRLDR